MDTMKKGIRCNETRNDSREGRDRIKFEFLSDDGVTPSSCTVQLGDIDTVTGEPVTDLTYFTEYHRMKDAQVRKNLMAERPEPTEKENARRKARKQACADAFCKRWGYMPSKDDVRYLMEEQEEERWNLSVNVLVNEKGKDHTCRYRELSALAEMDEEESVEMQALREVAASLTGRLAEVYAVMFSKANGEKGGLKFRDLVDKWDVSPKRINDYQEQIKAKVRKRAEEIRRQDYRD